MVCFVDSFEGLGLLGKNLKNLLHLPHLWLFYKRNWSCARSMGAKDVLSLSDNFSAATESPKTFKFIYIAKMLINDQKAEYRRA